MKLPEKPPAYNQEYIEAFKRFVEDIDSEKMRDILSKAIDYNNRYLYYSEVMRRCKDRKTAEFVWLLMKILRSGKYEEVDFAPVKMKYSMLPEFYAMLHKFDKFLAGNIGIETDSVGVSRKYIISSLMEEAIASSVLEGASTTRKVAKEMLKSGRRPKSRSEKMIANNYKTLRYIVENKSREMSPDFLLELQRMITGGTLENPEDEGRFRTRDDVIVGDRIEPDVIAHIPPKHSEIPKLVDAFCRFANNDSGKFIHPVLKGIILHFLIGYIHPFNDGNGRTARSIFYWYLISRGYWLFEYMTVSRIIVRSRKKYDLAFLFTEYDEMDLTYFFKYNLKCIGRALEDMLEYIRKKQREQQNAKAILHKNPGLNLRQAMIAEDFMKNPDKIFTIREIMETYSVAYETARRDMMELERRGIVKKRKAGKAFIFAFSGK